MTAADGAADGPFGWKTVRLMFPDVKVAGLASYLTFSLFSLYVAGLSVRAGGKKT